MVRAAIVFACLAVMAALFGFGGTLAGVALLGRVLFWGLALLAVLSFGAGLLGRRWSF